MLITLGAIGLSFAVAVAMIYYGGPAMSEGTVVAQVSALTNQSAQIGAASQFFTVENGGTPPTTLLSLKTSEYLGSIPGGWLEAPEGSTLISKEVTGSQSDTVCLQFNARYGIASIPACADVINSATPVCCQ